MAEYSETIGIEIKLSGAEASTRAIDRLTESLNRLKSTCDGIKSSSVSFDKLNTKVNESSNAFAKLGKVVRGAAVAKYLSDAISESMKFSETLNYAHISMGEYTDSAIEYANEVNKMYGINQSNWLSYQSVFANLTSGFGVAKDKAALMSQQLTQLSYDVQSVVGESMGLTTKETAQKIQSGIAGELEPVRRLGYDLSKVKLEAIAAELGITKLFSEMTQGEKVQLRYYALMTQLPEVHGDFGRTLNEPANRLRVLQESFVALSRAIGNIFIPILQAIIPPLTVLVQLLTALAQKIADFIAKLFGYTPNDIDYSNVDVGGFEAMADNIDTASGKAAKLKKQLAGFDEINNLTTNQPTSGSGGISSGGGWVDFELPTYDFFKDFAGSKIEEIKEKLTSLIPILVGIGVAFGTFMILPKIIDYVKNFDVVIGLLKESMTMLGGKAGGLWATLAKHPVAALIAVIAGLVAAFITAYNTSDEFRAKVDWVLSTIKKSFIDTFERIKASAGNFWQGLQDIWKWIKDGVVGLANGVIGAIESMVNSVRGGLNGLFRSLNRVGWTIPDWVPAIGGKSFGFSIKELQTVSFNRIQALATGGVTTGETIARIGEAGKEAVVPLERNTGWMDTLAAKTAEESAKGTDAILERIYDVLVGMDLSVNIDGQNLTNTVVNKINEMTRVQGKGVLI